MKKIVYLPLDERPCNYVFTQFLTEDNPEVRLVCPTPDELGDYKVPADYEKVAAFLRRECADADYLILAVDTLLYGGIVPSRLHHLSRETLLERLQVIKELKKNNPEMTIYAFSLVMRCPCYSCSDEEPDYYGQVGYEIFLYGQNEHKYALGIRSKEEYEATKELLRVCEPYLPDYLERRKINGSLLMDVLRMSGKEIKEVTILQDDSNPYGYTAMDQQKVREYIKETGAPIDVYPGADEGGMSLLARAICDMKSSVPKIYPVYPTEESKNFIPLYEDRAVYKSIAAQIQSAGATVAANADEADILLYCNAPVGEAHNIDRPYDEKTDVRDLPNFVAKMKADVEAGRAVAVADIAYCNGADVKLTELIDKEIGFLRLAGFAGWNTSSNSLGTVISQSVLYHFYGDTATHRRFTVERMYEDIGYCASVRKYVWDNEVEAMGYTYEDTKVRYGAVSERIEELLNAYMNEHYPDITAKYQLVDCHLPWRRMFEVGLTVREK